jgi:ribosomal protein L12E/L44/L45/RPP1/RPP2
VSVDELNAALEPTAELDGMPVGDPESTLMQAFTDDLAGIDADEMFATASHSLNAPAAGEIADAIGAAAAEDALEDLRNNRDEDGDLSDTLHEALMLLERDFEDDFTASQIIEQKQLKEALEDNSEQEDETRKTRKIS